MNDLPIHNLKIARFRGLRNLELNDCGRVNLLVRPNNSGKTSVLDALSLFCRPLDISNWREVAWRREIKSARTPLTEPFKWLFPQFLESDSAHPKSADTCHPSNATVTDEFKKEVDEALGKIKQLGLSESLTNRINGAVGVMKSARGSDRIRGFVDQNAIDQEVFNSWKRVRHAAAHGGLIKHDSIEGTLNDLNNVLHLCYAMLLSYVGYTGIRTNYSASGFPDESP